MVSMKEARLQQGFVGAGIQPGCAATQAYLLPSSPKLKVSKC